LCVKDIVPLLGTYRESNDVGIIDFSGKIKLGEGTSMLRQMVRDMVAGGKRNILLNFSNVDYIDSAGIGELVASYMTVRNAGGEVKLLNLTRNVRDVIQITRLFTIFDIQSDEAIALRSFQPH
jgi:anti-sigma B factor antagonist